MKSKIIFANEKLKNNFLKLKTTKNLEKNLHKQLIKAFGKIEKNAFCGIQIPKKIIPKEYEVKNLWKLNLSNGWRLLYTVKNDKIIIISIILEWFPHKKYEKKFKY